MKCNKRSFGVVCILFTVFMSLPSAAVSTGTLNARDADLASLTFAFAPLGSTALGSQSAMEPIPMIPFAPAVVVHRGSFEVAAQTAKQSQCIRICRARYRDCQSKKQIPSFECRDVYQDCRRFTCNVQG
jgi:hypothetical protein